jgi:dCTP diphosphatase
MEHFREKLAIFAKDRDWDQFHTPRNLLMALTGEVGELAGNSVICRDFLMEGRGC